MIMESVVCAFCGKSFMPKPVSAHGLVKYRCDECGSLAAAYASEFDNQLRFGSIFDSYTLDKYKPNLPPYVKRSELQSE